MGNWVKQLWKWRCKDCKRCKRCKRCKGCKWPWKWPCKAKSKKNSLKEEPTENELWQEYYGPFLHFLSFQEISTRLETNPTLGLTHELAERKLERNGRNVLPTFPKQNHLIVRYLRYCCSILGMIILVNAIVCFYLYHHEYKLHPNDITNPEYMVAGCCLLIIFFMAGLVVVLHEDYQEAMLRATRQLMPMYCTVIREGRKEIILAEHVVLGDIVPISYGQRLPADLRFFSTNGLEVDNVALMGYSEPWQINPLVTDGSQRTTYSRVEY